MLPSHQQQPSYNRRTRHAMSLTVLAALTVLAVAGPAWAGAITDARRGLHLPNCAMTSEMVAGANYMDPRMVVVLTNVVWDHDNDNYSYASGWMDSGTLGYLKSLSASTKIFVRLSPTTCPRGQGYDSGKVVGISPAVVADAIRHGYEYFLTYQGLSLTRWIPGNEPAIEWGGPSQWNYYKWADIGNYYSQIWDAFYSLPGPAPANVDLYTPAFTPFACVGVGNYHADGSVTREPVGGGTPPGVPSDNFNSYRVGYNVAAVKSMIQKYDKFTWHDYWWPGSPWAQRTRQWFPPWLASAIAPLGSMYQHAYVTEANWIIDVLKPDDEWDFDDWDLWTVNSAKPWSGYYEKDLKDYVDFCSGARGIAIWLLASRDDDYRPMAAMEEDSPGLWVKRPWFEGLKWMLDGNNWPRAWELNDDRVVNILDIVLVSGKFGQTGPPGWIREDITVDGVIDILDLVVVSAHFGDDYNP